MAVTWGAVAWAVASAEAASVVVREVALAALLVVEGLEVSLGVASAAALAERPDRADKVVAAEEMAAKGAHLGRLVALVVRAVVKAAHPDRVAAVARAVRVVKVVRLVKAAPQARMVKAGRVALLGKVVAAARVGRAARAAVEAAREDRTSCLPA